MGDGDRSAEGQRRPHWLGRTQASIIDKATGSLRAAQILLGHTKIDSTACYLGIDVEHALALAESTGV